MLKRLVAFLRGSRPPQPSSSFTATVSFVDDRPRERGPQDASAADALIAQLVWPAAMALVDRLAGEDRLTRLLDGFPEGGAELWPMLSDAQRKLLEEHWARRGVAAPDVSGAPGPSAASARPEPVPPCPSTARAGSDAVPSPRPAERSSGRAGRHHLVTSPHPLRPTP